MSLNKQQMEEIILIAKEAEKRKIEIEQLRNIPLDIMKRIKENGIIKSWVAKEYGGTQKSIQQVSHQIQDIAYYNGSLAWVVGVTGCTSLFSGFLKPTLAQKLFGDADSMVGGFAGPTGIAYKVNGGLKVTGHWTWGSGVTHCSHIVGGVKIMEGEAFLGTAVVFFHPDQVKLYDNWNVLGLRGTNSIDYSVQEIFVDNKDWSVFPQSAPYIKGALYSFSFLGALSIAVASVGFGLAHRAYDELILLAQVKQPFGAGKTLSQRESFQLAVGKIKADLNCAQALLCNTIDDGWAEAEKGNTSVYTKANIRMMAAQVTLLCKQVVTKSYELAGGSAVWENQKFEELLRDMNMVSQHGMVNASNFRTAGAVYLGQEVPHFLL